MPALMQLRFPAKIERETTSLTIWFKKARHILVYIDYVLDVGNR
jgi:hypothetical protein